MIAARVRSSVERYFDFHVDVLAVQIIHNIVDLPTFQGNIAAAPFP